MGPDEATGLQNNLNRWYDPTVGRWLSEDPIGFEGGDANLYRYVGNGPINAVDARGLQYNPWAWHWHHLLPQEVFTQEFIKKHGLSIDPGSSGYGWMLRGKDHIGKGGVHSQGWNQEWKKWIKAQEAAGKKITQKMIDDKLLGMMDKYRLNVAGVPAEFSYKMRKKAYAAAQKAAKLKVAKVLGALGIAGAVLDKATLAKNMINEPPEARIAMQKFLMAYKGAVGKAQRKGYLSATDKRHLFEALVKYLKSMGMDTSKLEYAFEIGMNGRGR